MKRVGNYTPGVNNKRCLLWKNWLEKCCILYVI